MRVRQTLSCARGARVRTGLRVRNRWRGGLSQELVTRSTRRPLSWQSPHGVPASVTSRAGGVVKCLGPLRSPRRLGSWPVFGMNPMLANCAAQRCRSRTAATGRLPVAANGRFGDAQFCPCCRPSATIGGSLAPIGSPIPRRNGVRFGPQPKPCGLRLRLQRKQSRITRADQAQPAARPTKGSR